MTELKQRMRLMKPCQLNLLSTLSVLLLVAISQPGAQTPRRDNRPRTASISGRVTIGGGPAPNARVGLVEVKHQTRLGNQQIFMESGGMNAGEGYSALTDADGRYRLTNLPEGNYEMRVMLKAYIAEKKTGDKDLVRSVSLGESETRNDVDFSLTRGGVITGRVTDAGGNPMISRRVLLQVVTEQGQKQPYQSSASSQMFETDDRGVYRLYGLRAGRYVVSAGGEGGFALAGSSSGKHPRTWSPDTDDENQAKIVEVKEGGEVTGVDIKFGLAKKAYEASGRVIDDATGEPIPKVSVMCMRTGNEGAVSFGAEGGQATTDSQGNFRFNGLGPGRYEVEMMDMNSFLSGGGENKHYIERTTFEVKAGDVENIEVRAKIGATISGVAVVEGARDASVKAMLTQSMITFESRQERSDDPQSASSFGSSVGGIPSKIKADGSFEFSGVRPGKVTFDVANFSGKSLSLIRVERNGADVSDGIDVQVGENVAGVRIVVGHGTAVIRGQVNVVGGALPEGWRMHAYASREKSAGRSVRFAQVDGKGRFVIEGLLPGEYTLTATAIPPPPPPGAPPGQRISQPVQATQKVAVGNGAEVQVTLTLDLKKKDQEE
jgi:hypothetical protein